MIKRKKKVCKGCGEERYLFGHGLCEVCYHKSTPRRRKSLYGSKIPVRKRKKTVTEEWLQEWWGFKSQVELFNYIWETERPVCLYTGKDLTPFRDRQDLRNRCCAHYLPKGKYPLFKLNRTNVALVHPTFHRIVDQGTQEEREKHPDWWWNGWDLTVKMLKEDYKAFKKEHLL